MRGQEYEKVAAELAQAIRACFALTAGGLYATFADEAATVDPKLGNLNNI